MGLTERELIPEVTLPEPKLPEADTVKAAVVKETSPSVQKVQPLIREPKPSYQAEKTGKINGVVSSTPEDQKKDYFMQKMKERVTSYHNQNSHAEVIDPNAVSPKALQTEKIKSAIERRKTEETERNLVNDSKETECALQKESDKIEELSIKTEYTLENTQKTEQLDLFEEKFLKKEVRQEYTIIGQVFETYWLIQYKDSLYIIDQHAAHERVLYERTLKGMKSRAYTSQYLSPPIILSLSMQEADLLHTYKEQFTSIGFEIEPFGGEEYAVRAIPDNLFGIAKKELLMEMLDALSEGLSSNLAANLIDEKIASMSCKAAVKGNSRLSMKEVDALIGELLSLENPYHCPHGRPTIISMTKRELEKKFKRIV